MPRHLISDANEWISEIPTVPIYSLANPQPRERAWNKQRGKKTLLSLTLVRLVKWHSGYSLGGREIDTVKPLPALSFCLFHYEVAGERRFYVIRLSVCLTELCGRNGQMGSLAGAAYLLNSNAGVLW